MAFGSTVHHPHYPPPHDRTSYWVQHHAPAHAPYFASPSAPQPPPPDAVYDEDAASYSDESLPPRMRLKYADGRDVPISYWPGAQEEEGDPRRHSRQYSHHPASQPHPRAQDHRDRYPDTSHPQHQQQHHPDRHHRHRSLSEQHGRPLEDAPTEWVIPGHTSSRHGRQHRDQGAMMVPRLPEKIIVLPSRTDQAPQARPASGHQAPSAAATYASSSHHLQQQQHRHGRHPSQQQPTAMTVPLAQSYSQPASSRSHPVPRPHTSHSVRRTAAATGGHAVPPGHAREEHYYHAHRAAGVPPHQYAPGVVYSHSAPVPLTTAPPHQGYAYPHPQQPAYPPGHGAHAHDGRGLGHRGVLVEDDEGGFFDSRSIGTRTRVVSREPSIYTATTPTRVPSHGSHASPHKKPFFARIFSKFTPTDVHHKGSGSIHLQRRHSIGATSRR